MILVAFVLVLVAAVTLIIGAFFSSGGGVPLIWVSIAACVATFGVLGANYLARRRAATEGEAARPAPLGDGAARTPTPAPAAPAAPAQDAPAAEPDVEDDYTIDDEPTVTIVPGGAEQVDAAAEEPTPEPAAEEPEPAPVAVEEPVAEPEPEPEPAAEEEPESESVPAAMPAPRKVAPRRVVRPAAAAPAAAAAATPTTRRVVRRVAPSGTRTVVRRTGEASGTGAAGQRTVKRVVRRAPAAATGAAAAAPAAKASGTRGKKAREVLSQIKGVGPAKQDALLKKFGSLEAMAAAPVAELTEVKGVGQSVAEAIKAELQAR